LGFVFSALSVINNAFLCGDTADRFSYIVIRPHGTGHSISGLDNTGDTFRAVNGMIGRVDTSFSDVVYSKLNNIRIEGKSFHNIKTYVANPATKVHQ